MSLHSAFHEYVEKNAGKDLLICLTHVGPLRGVVSKWEGSSDSDVFQILNEAQNGPNGALLKVPFVFSTDALLWFSPGVTEEPRSRIVGAFDS